MAHMLFHLIFNRYVREGHDQEKVDEYPLDTTSMPAGRFTVMSDGKSTQLGYKCNVLCHGILLHKEITITRNGLISAITVGGKTVDPG